jgi:hypothetical protein
MDEEIENRRKWFLQYITNLELKSLFKECTVTEFDCPCCNYPTLPERGAYHICPLCFWEDDGQDEPFQNEVWGGPNGDYSLTEARNNFSKYFTCYRPEDKEQFARNTEKNHVKMMIIKKFDGLKRLNNNESCKKIKKEIKKLMDQLF